MSGVKNKEILRLLKEEIKKSKITQTELSNRLGITPAFLSRQLSGRDALSIDRAYTILKILNPIDRHKISDLLRDEIYSLKDDEKDDVTKLNRKQKIEMLGRDPWFDFLLDFWIDLPVEDKFSVFKLFVDFIEKKQKRDTEKNNSEK